MITDQDYEKKYVDLIAEEIPVTLKETKERLDDLELRVSALTTALEAAAALINDAREAKELVKCPTVTH